MGVTENAALSAALSRRYNRDAFFLWARMHSLRNNGTSAPCRTLTLEQGCTRRPCRCQEPVSNAGRATLGTGVRQPFRKTDSTTETIKNTVSRISEQGELQSLKLYTQGLYIYREIF